LNAANVKNGSLQMPQFPVIGYALQISTNPLLPWRTTGAIRGEC
jgi:hypothetical protein